MNRLHSHARGLAALVIVACMLPLARAEVVYFGDALGNVGQVDTGSMVATAVGSLPAQGFTLGQGMGLAYDPARDRILINDRDSIPARVFSMNPATGVATVLFTPPVPFEGGAVCGDTLYGIDESAQAFLGFSLTTFAQTVTGGPTLGTSHGLGLDAATGALFARNSSSQIYRVMPAGTAGAVLVTAASGVEDIDMLPSGDFVGVNLGRELSLIDGATGAVSVLLTDAQLGAAGCTAPMVGVAARQSPTLLVRSIQTTTTQAPPGQTLLDVAMSVENLGTDAIDLTGADLSFLDAARADVTTDYVVSPMPGNPSSVPATGLATLNFSVDIAPDPTLGAITLDGAIQGVVTATGRVFGDAGADTTDTWNVIGAVPTVRLVCAPGAAVMRGTSGNPITVLVQNTGLAELTVTAVTLSFVGAADRAADFIVTPAPSNPTVIAPGAGPTWIFTVAVTPTAIPEVVALDCSCTGYTTVSGAPVFDPGADIVDSWTVLGCSAPQCGDCNGDAAVSILDSLSAAQHAVGIITLFGTQFANCNVFGPLDLSPGAEVSILDALALAQVSAGLPVALVCCQ